MDDDADEPVPEDALPEDATPDDAVDEPALDADVLPADADETADVPDDAATTPDDACAEEAPAMETDDDERPAEDAVDVEALEEDETDDDTRDDADDARDMAEEEPGPLDGLDSVEVPAEDDDTPSVLHTPSSHEPDGHAASDPHTRRHAPSTQRHASAHSTSSLHANVGAPGRHSGHPASSRSNGHHALAQRSVFTPGPVPPTPPRHRPTGCCPRAPPP